MDNLHLLIIKNL